MCAAEAGTAAWSAQPKLFCHDGTPIGGEKAEVASPAWPLQLQQQSVNLNPTSNLQMNESSHRGSKEVARNGLNSRQGSKGTTGALALLTAKRNSSKEGAVPSLAGSKDRPVSKDRVGSKGRSSSKERATSKERRDRAASKESNAVRSEGSLEKDRDREESDLDKHVDGLDDSEVDSQDLEAREEEQNFQKQVAEVRHLGLHELGFSESYLHDLVRTFRKFDEDSSGSLNVNDLMCIMRHLGQPVTVRRVYMLLQKHDADGTGELEVNEFLRIIAAHEMEETQNLKTVFDELDVDKSGDISAIELSGLFNKLGHDIPLEDIKVLMEEFDTDGNDLFSFQEFKSMSDKTAEMNKKKFTKFAGFSLQEVDHFQAVFNSFDRDRSGQLAFVELFQVMDMIGIVCKNREQQELLNKRLKMADNDGSGQLDFYEFLHLIRRFNDETAYQEFAREKRAAEQVGLTDPECEEFLNIFQALRTEDASGALEFTLSSARALMRSLGVQLTAGQMSDLKMIFAKYAGSAATLGQLDKKQEKDGKDSQNEQEQDSGQGSKEPHKAETYKSEASQASERKDTKRQATQALDADEPPKPQTGTSSLTYPEFLLFVGELIKRDFCGVMNSAMQTLAKSENEERKLMELMDQVQQQKEKKQELRNSIARKTARKSALLAEQAQKRDREKENEQKQNEAEQKKEFLTWYKKEKERLAERKAKLKQVLKEKREEMEREKRLREAWEAHEEDMVDSALAASRIAPDSPKGSAQAPASQTESTQDAENKGPSASEGGGPSPSPSNSPRAAGVAKA
eukprot:gnl/MRDRNA2_/MRDRNA2_98732_c0_seq1.p1 gnl/MRDRNA2_/MRDRNA2_98732_c0~~gnl/MRDRNA2_/MRDRNA2_98732_c0_seq1.p1  ORF type:complete len:884 (+),score=216.23 gnl/MRDRNA2_/MRDRNA2_98732_c0_seq1:265-2652(+)